MQKKLYAQENISSTSVFFFSAEHYNYRVHYIMLNSLVHYVNVYNT